MTDFATLRQRMVDNQIRPSDVSDHDVLRAFLAVPREMFVTASERPFAYGDRPLLMSEATPDRRLLEPAPLARLVQALPRGPDTKAMVVACGSGYSVAILSRLARSVVAVEDDPTLNALAAESLQSVGVANVTLLRGDPMLGHPDGGPYDAVLLEGAVEIAPDGLVSQLTPGGMLATIERLDRVSRATLYERVGDGVTKWPLFEAWAPLLPGFRRKPEFVF